MDNTVEINDIQKEVEVKVNSKDNEIESVDLEAFENFERSISKNDQENKDEEYVKIATTEQDDKTGETASEKNKCTKNLRKHKDLSKTSKRVLKRSSRRRSSENNKSVLQSAIARKEKSFGEYNKTSNRSRQVKVKENIEKTDSCSLLKKTLLSPSKTTKKKLSNSIKPVESLEQSKLDETNLRRSRRTSSSETKTSAVKYMHTTNDERINPLRLCRCTENKNLLMENDSINTSPFQFCCAIDGIEDKLIGCTKLVDIKTVPLVRPSVKFPFGLYCNSHRARLIKHNCCSTCGIFCTQGQFVQCKLRHYFHKDCNIQLGNKNCCPHCGDPDNCTDIIISMHTSKDPIFLPIQKSYLTSAKMTFQYNRNENRFNCATKLVSSLDDIQVNKTDCELKVSPNETTEHSLAEAITSENISQVMSLLKSETVDTKAKLTEFSNGTFLHLAVITGNLAIVHLLVSSKVDVDALNKEQNTALIMAAKNAKNDILSYLIQCGADITVKGTDGMTALHVAAKYGNLNACKILIGSCFGILNFINFQDDGGWTPLVWACEYGHIEIVKFLISKGADINLRDVEYNMALHWAAFRGNVAIAELLLNRHSDVNVLNVHGDTPLHIAARGDHLDCILLLLLRGGDISIMNKTNETPLDSAPADGKCSHILALNSQLTSAISSCSDKRKFILANDISHGKEQNPIQCYNNVDNEMEPKNYIYIKKNCISSNEIKIDLRVSIIQFCSCTDRCVEANCKCAELSLGRWYDEEGKLISDFNYNDPPLIFECNELCSCNTILCLNRLIQKPLSHRFQLFRTKTKGWGIQTLNAVLKGSYVCEYVGEILTDTEADHREDDSYLFDLDNKENESFCIDAKFYGNFARFINHSCEPNLYPVKVFVDHHDLRFPRIALFAKRNIDPEEELSFDYGDKFWLIKYKLFSCDCGSSNCKYSPESIAKILEKYQMLSTTTSNQDK